VSIQQIPVDSQPNQTWQVSVQVGGAVLTFFVALSYNEIALYWVMSIFDSNQNLLLSGIPFVTGLNLLQQFGYLGLGSIYIVNVSGVQQPNYPNNQDLGKDFQMVWAD
jgi:hypothetical protein